MEPVENNVFLQSVEQNTSLKPSMFGPPAGLNPDIAGMEESGLDIFGSPAGLNPDI